MIAGYNRRMGAKACGLLHIAAAAALAVLAAACSGEAVRSPTCTGQLDDFDLWVNTDGGVTRLTDTAGADTFPRWSPDGKRIAFVSSRDGNCEIYVMGADGSSPVNVTRTEFDEVHPSWSPDGERIVVASDEAGGADLVVIDAATGERTLLTDGGLIHNYPDWSPGGGLIAFSGGQSPAGPGSIHELHIVSEGGGTPKALTDFDSLLAAPEWSPSGSRLAFHNQGDPFSVWIAQADGSSPEETALGGHLSWSPDGDSIVFDREEDDGVVNLLTLDLVSGSEELLVESRWVDALPDWSPDGESIVFTSNRP